MTEGSSSHKDISSIDYIDFDTMRFDYMNRALRVAVLVMVWLSPAQGYQTGSAGRILGSYLTRPRSTAAHRPISITLPKATEKDWDAIIAAEEEPEDLIAQALPVPPDMRYIPRNCLRQLENFNTMRPVIGKDLVHDVYVRDPKNDVFWYVGKVCRVSDVTVEQCVARQWNLIENHASNLRQRDLFPGRGQLQIWVAPGDSELQVAYNRPDIVFKKMPKHVPNVESIKNIMVGYKAEANAPGEEGFRTWRTEEGLPVRPEIDFPQQDLLADFEDDDNDIKEKEIDRTKSYVDVNGNTLYGATQQEYDDDMKKIQEALQGRDIQAVWKEQQERLGIVVDDENEDADETDNS
jgi:hypothetical protein